MSYSIRPIRPDDKDALASFTRGLSDKSRLRRFLGPKPKLSARELVYLTEVDYRRHVALVAVDEADRIVGVARYAAGPDEVASADVAFAIADSWQGRGLGTALGRQLVATAAINGMRELRAWTFADNLPARRLLRRLGFSRPRTEAGVTEYRLSLSAVEPPLAA